MYGLPPLPTIPAPVDMIPSLFRSEILSLMRMSPKQLKFFLGRKLYPYYRDVVFARECGWMEGKFEEPHLSMNRFTQAAYWLATTPHPKVMPLTQMEARKYKEGRERLKDAYSARCPSGGLPAPYGFIGTSWLAYDKMVPQDPQLTLEEDPPRLCLDMASEEKLQNQRKFSMYIGGPAVFIAGSKLKGPFGLFIMGLGVACTVWHATAHKKVKEITGV